MSRRMLVELQRAAEMMREQMPSSSARPNTRTDKPPDRARDAVAIKIERRQVRRADILRHVHFHAVDDGKEILALAGRMPSTDAT